MGIFSGNSEQDVGTALVLSEMRDMRASMDKRDERLRDDIGEIRRSVTDLTSAVQISQNNQQAIQDDVVSVKGTVSDLSGRVGSLEESKKLADASWMGPKRAMITVIFVGSFITALVALITNWGKLMSMGATG